LKRSFFEDGYYIYKSDPRIATWAKAAIPLAADALEDQEMLAKWLMCEGTWFVGVDALATGPKGEAGDSPLAGEVISDLVDYLPTVKPMHRGQLSVVYPGYPKPRDGESKAAFRYRAIRDAAHVDGLHAVGADRRRKLSEHHAYLLGLPLTTCNAAASPLVAWRGSHIIVQDWLRSEFEGIAADHWGEVDLTDAYLEIRRKIFDTCERVTLWVEPGQAVLLHRHALHGIAPWGESAVASPHGRMIAYFRPEISSDLSQWLYSA
jgi:hypothetical protein